MLPPNAGGQDPAISARELRSFGVRPPARATEACSRHEFGRVALLASFSRPCVHVMVPASASRSAALRSGAIPWSGLPSGSSMSCPADPPEDRHAQVAESIFEHVDESSTAVLDIVKPSNDPRTMPAMPSRDPELIELVSRTIDDNPEALWRRRSSKNDQRANEARRRVQRALPSPSDCRRRVGQSVAPEH